MIMFFELLSLPPDSCISFEVDDASTKKENGLVMDCGFQDSQSIPPNQKRGLHGLLRGPTRGSHKTLPQANSEYLALTPGQTH